MMKIISREAQTIPISTYTELMNHMVESARRGNIIEKLQICLKKKSQEMKDMKRKLRYYKNVQSPRSVVKGGGDEESESKQNDKQELDPRVSSFVPNRKNGGGVLHTVVMGCVRWSVEKK